ACAYYLDQQSRRNEITAHVAIEHGRVELHRYALRRGRTGIDRFEPIAKMAHHSDFNVREQVARALADFGGERAVPVLAEMAAKNDEAIWGLIRLGDIAVPAIPQLSRRSGQARRVPDLGQGQRLFI
ncbi:MAG: HEAT repeat domain-containing protein, partial [Delftia sp.]|nr:HEAT repeat domain-containing protein [Delftia sp.]